MSNSPVTYIPNFVEAPSIWFDRLWFELDWEKRPDAPRKEYWTNLFGRSYTYGRGAGERTYHSKADHPLIKTCRADLAERFGFVLEGCFLNGYGTARDWLGWHADDDPAIDHTKPIAVVTVGQGRVIKFREVIEPRTAESKAVYGEAESLMLEAGSLLLMHAGMQATHEHCIPKAGFEVKPRISMTFRGLVA
jgi:alkylated DNA repair dioxygenase AlkB